MKKMLLFAALVLFVGLLSSSKDSNSTMGNYIFMVDGNEPDLPTTPFSYEFELPDHLQGRQDTIQVGYETSEPDTTLVPIVSDEGATLGRVLFYDKKLSALENISCGSCHLQESSFADNKALSQGVETLTTRNSMALNDIAWTNNNTFFWDFRGSDLHSAIALPLTDDNEIGADMNDIAAKLRETNYYPQLFRDAYGTPHITQDRIVDALVQFMASITTFNSKFDQGIQNGFSDFSESELNGKELFASNCSSCHKEGSQFAFFGEIFTQDEGLERALEIFGIFFNNGLESEPTDKGAGEWLREDFAGLYKAPTLRNIEFTAPYMHDGRHETLDEVIEHYSTGIQETSWGGVPVGGFKFSETEKRDLKNFMLTLSDRSMLTEEKWSDPFGLPTGTDELDIEVTIRPNPMDAFAEIVVTDNSQRIDVQITDMGGRVIKRDYFTSSQYIIEKGNLSTGVYFVRLLRGNESAGYKLIVQ